MELEINRIENIIEKLNTECKDGEKFKNEVNDIIEKNKIENNTGKEKFYIQNVLEPLEKKLFNLKQIILIKEQNVLAFEIIRRNNKEIISNLERIKNVTIEALNTAVIVAKSIYNQKIVLNKIKMLENGTSSLIKSTASELKNQTEKIAKSSRPEDTLKNAFEKAFETLNILNEDNKKYIPENESKIIELKKMGESYE